MLHWRNHQRCPRSAARQQASLAAHDARHRHRRRRRDRGRRARHRRAAGGEGPHRGARHDAAHGESRASSAAAGRRDRGRQQRLTIDDAKAVDERATTLLAVQPEMRSIAAGRLRQQEHEHADHRDDAELSRGAEVHAQGGQDVHRGGRRRPAARGGRRLGRRRQPRHHDA